MKTDNTRLFRDLPVQKAVLSLAVPTVISQIITVIYNMADTLFIGQLNDPNQVAAATVCMPAFVVMTALANLFGIGGAGKISRALGVDDRKTARACAAFCFWGAAAVALVYGTVLYFARPWVLPLLGADDATYDYACSYTFWTITLGAMPTVLSATLAHLVRAEGYAKHAAIGVAFGGILNMLLDPLFIFVFRMEITGAAIATMISNIAALIYFLALLAVKRGQSVVSLKPMRGVLKRGGITEVLFGGLPSFLMSLLASFSGSMLNRLTAGYSNEAIAGMGIAKKIDMIAFAVAQGMTQGVLPLIGYNYAAGNRKRMTRSILVTLSYALAIACTAMLALFFFAEPITRAFIDNDLTVDYGKQFLKVICWICPSTAINFMIITVFQATNQRIKPMILSFLRKGRVDVPLMFLLEKRWGFSGIAWGIPIAEWVALAVALCMFIPYLRKLRLPAPQPAHEEA